MEFFLVIEQGLDLMLTGMMTVFTFLGLLILLINLSSLIFKDSPITKSNQDKIPETSNIPGLLKLLRLCNKNISLRWW